ncbi:MAG: acetoin dehydrogenase dihydrolipoyllysine-residue acetyltransferase subunit [Hyphomicrobiales bacterium]|nr:acetoin dehydrogenase dihydrolipoyllysine-residue acetyltransferase subunit [Hyphomicrobiales bacterium]
MATEVILPRVDMDMTEGRISRWYVEEGASVTKGQPIFEIETEKAAMEVEAPASGVIRDLATALEMKLPVGSVIAWIDAAGESGGKGMRSSTEDRAETKAKTPTTPDETAQYSIEEQSAPPPMQADHPAQLEGDGSAFRRATPLARHLAREHDVDLSSLEGSGPKGRIQATDVERSRAKADAAKAMPDRAARAKPSGAVLHCRWLRQGEGVPLVMIHGFGADLNAWRLFLAAARLGSPVLGIDLPGHGGSAARKAPSFDAMVAQVAATLRAECSDALHLAGHSLGGAVAAALSRHEETKPLSLFLIAPAGLGREINGEFISGFARAQSAAELAPFLPMLVSDPSVLGSSFIKATLRQRNGLDAGLENLGATLFPGATQAFSIRSVFEGLPIPAKIVLGGQDQIIPPRYTSGLPGNVAIHAFPALGHMPHVEAPDAVARLLRELMQSAAPK